MASAAVGGAAASGAAAGNSETAASYAKLIKAWQKRQDGKSSSDMWDRFKPVAENGAAPPGGAPAPVVGVSLQALCGKRLSAANPTVSNKNHSNCNKCKEVFEARQAAAVAERTCSSRGSSSGGGGGGGSSSSSSSGGGRAPTQNTAGSGGSALVPVGGSSGLQIIAEMEGPQPAKRLRTQDAFVWRSAQQGAFERDWTEAAIADGDSFRSAGAGAAKAGVIFKHFGATVPSRKRMAGLLLDDVYKAAVQYRDDVLGSVNGFVYAVDGGKDKYIARGTKLVSSGALLPDGRCLYLGTYNTADATLNHVKYQSIIKETSDGFGGMSRVTGLVTDGENVCRRTAAELLAEYPHLCYVVCQAHGLHHVVQDMQQLDAVGEMFTACNGIVSALAWDKALRAAFKSLAERHGTSGLIRPAPSHRFAYQVFEAQDVYETFSALEILARDPVWREKSAGFVDSIDFINGDTLLGSGSSMFSLKDTLALVLPHFTKLQCAIAQVEANRSHLGIVEPMWRTLESDMSKLGDELQQSRRGRGAEAAMRRSEAVVAIVRARRGGVPHADFPAGIAARPHQLPAGHWWRAAQAADRVV